MAEPTAQGAQRRLLRAFRILVAATCILGTVAVVTTYLAFRNEGAWAPLRPYAQQHVLNSQRFVTLEDPYLRTSAVKCLARGITQPVKVVAVRQYQLLLPPGTVVNAGAATSTRYPANVRPPKINGFRAPTAGRDGCLRLKYANQLPEAVMRRSAEVCRLTGFPALWKLTGTESPESDGRRGVTRTWETEPFRVACA